MDLSSPASSRHASPAGSLSRPISLSPGPQQRIDSSPRTYTVPDNDSDSQSSDGESCSSDSESENKSEEDELDLEESRINSSVSPSLRSLSRKFIILSLIVEADVLTFQ